MSVPWIGKPRRHHFHINRSRYLPCPGPRLLVRNQWHRCRFAASVAALTFILQYRKHILIKGRRRDCLWHFLVSPGNGAGRLPRSSDYQDEGRSREKHPGLFHERKNSKVNAQAGFAECGSHASLSPQKKAWPARENSAFTSILFSAVKASAIARPVFGRCFLLLVSHKLCSTAHTRTRQEM